MAAAGNGSTGPKKYKLNVFENKIDTIKVGGSPAVKKGDAGFGYALAELKNHQTDPVEVTLANQNNGLMLTNNAADNTWSIGKNTIAGSNVSDQDNVSLIEKTQKYMDDLQLAADAAAQGPVQLTPATNAPTQQRGATPPGGNRAGTGTGTGTGLGASLGNKKPALPAWKDGTHYDYYGTDNMLLQVLIAMFDFFVSPPFQALAFAALKVVAPVISEVRGAWNFGWGVVLMPFAPPRWSKDLRDRGKALSGTLPLVDNAASYLYHTSLGRIFTGSYSANRRDQIINKEWIPHLKNSAIAKLQNFAGLGLSEMAMSTEIYAAKFVANFFTGHWPSAARNVYDWASPFAPKDGVEPGMLYKLREIGWDFFGQGPGFSFIGGTTPLAPGDALTLYGGYDDNGNIERPLNTVGILPTYFGTHEREEIGSKFWPSCLYNAYYHPDARNQPKATYNATYNAAKAFVKAPISFAKRIARVLTGHANDEVPNNQYNSDVYGQNAHAVHAARAALLRGDVRSEGDVRPEGDVREAAAASLARTRAGARDGARDGARVVPAPDLSPHGGAAASLGTRRPATPEEMPTRLGSVVSGVRRIGSLVVSNVRGLNPYYLFKSSNNAHQFPSDINSATLSLQRSDNHQIPNAPP